MNRSHFSWHLVQHSWGYGKFKKMGRCNASLWCSGRLLTPFLITLGFWQFCQPPIFNEFVTGSCVWHELFVEYGFDRPSNYCSLLKGLHSCVEEFPIVLCSSHKRNRYADFWSISFACSWRGKCTGMVALMSSTIEPQCLTHLFRLYFFNCLLRASCEAYFSCQKSAQFLPRMCQQNSVK